MKPRLLSLLPTGLMLIAAIGFVSSDNSLLNVQTSKTLKVCVPQYHPPLSTQNSRQPGVEIELAQALARQMGLQLALVYTPSQGLGEPQPISPGRCNLLMGGVVDAGYNPQFEFVGPRLESGWALLYPHSPSLENSKVAVYPGLSGLDRLALSDYLKLQRAEIIPVGTPGELRQQLSTGKVGMGATEALLARHLAAQQGWQVVWAPKQARYPLKLFGVWKREKSLRREVNKVVQTLEKSGTLEEILAHYPLAPIHDK